MGAAKKLSVEQWYELDEDESSDELVGRLRFGRGTKLVIRPDRGRVPDGIIFTTNDLEKEGPVRTPPDIVIEITLVAASSAGKVRRIPTLPGLVIDLDDLWSEVARIERATAR